MLDFLLTLWLLSPLPAPEQMPRAWDEALLRVACDLDLSTPAEGWERCKFGTGFRWTRDWLRLLANAPSSDHACRFPPLDVCQQSLIANRAFRQYLEARLTCGFLGWAEHEAAIAECYALALAWESARNVATPGTLSFRRHELKRLREHLGEADWWSGRMPPCVPLHLLRPID